MDVLDEDGPNHRVAHSDGRSSLPMYKSRLESRKSFQPRRETQDGLRPTSESPTEGRAVLSPSPSSSSSNSGVNSPKVSRIPRPPSSQSSNPRQSFNLHDAYRRALAEENTGPVLGSPSPAPRPYRTRADGGDNGIQNLINQRPLSLARRGSRQSSGSLRDDESLLSAETNDERARPREPMQHQNDRERMESVVRGSYGFFNKARVGEKAAEKGRELSRKASNSSLNGRSGIRPPQTWGVLAKPDPDFARRLAASPEPTRLRGGVVSKSPPADLSRVDKDVPIPSIETEPRAVNRSPEKSFAWQAEADFTAGDLQVSDSPMVKVAKRSKLEELKSFQPSNTKIDELRRREQEVLAMFPDEPPLAGEETEGGSGFGSENSQGPGKNRFLERTNTKIPEIRAREIESLNKRAVATARLDDIRARNSESRSLSPEAVRKPGPGPEPELASTPATADEKREVGGEVLGDRAEGEQIPGTPVVVFRKASVSHGSKASNPGSGSPLKEAGETPGKGESGAIRGKSHSGEDSQDVLRRLARAASSSPSLDQQASEQGLGEGNWGESENKPTHSPGKVAAPEEQQDRERDKEEPTAAQRNPVNEAKVFASVGRIRRAASTGSSRSSKRSSVVNSEPDPIDRIEAEMRLFAPGENQSERGSIRAPSPDADDDEDDDVEETPRSAKQPDLLSMPTPRVTGAYVETPATIKVEDMDGHAQTLRQKAKGPSALSASALFRNRGRPKSPANGKSSDEAGGLSSAVSRRRARSLPRARSPLINSIKLPSAKDDLMEIQRKHHVDDDTLDDIDLFASQGVEALEIGATVELAESKGKTKADAVAEDALDREREMEAYERMSRSLQTGLLGIQTAKKGIERLEDRISQAEVKALQHAHSPGDTAADCTVCGDRQPKPAVTYVHFPMPRLYYREPKFRLSTLGLILCLLGAWYCAESTMCAYYCRPAACAPELDCTWSPDDPFFGYAIPVKLDQWTTGGKGRVIANRLSEEIGDLTAEAWAAVRGVDMVAVDTRYMDFEQRRRHRRRLRKRGLLKRWRAPAEHKPSLDAWASATEERERACAMRDMGYDIGDGLGSESMDGDERVPDW